MLAGWIDVQMDPIRMGSWLKLWMQGYTEDVLVSD